MNSSPSQSKQVLFRETLVKAQALARIFNGEVRSDTGFSICKGQFSIRFLCQNEHNFFLPADRIRNLDLDEVKQAYKSYRLRLQKLFESSKEANSNMSCEKNSIQLAVADTCWCLRCVEYFNHCLATYNYQTLNLVGGLFTKYIMYQCRKEPHHLFCVSSVRKHKFQKQYKIHDYACPECK